MKNFASAVKEKHEDWRKKSEEFQRELKEKKNELLAVSKKLEKEILEKNEIENKLIECYKYLGTINRQLAILLDFGKNGNEGNGKYGIDFILDSALNLSGANAAAFYYFNENNGKLNLASSIGADQSLICKNFSKNDCKLLAPLFLNKTRIHGKFASKELEKTGLNSKIKYFMALPIMKEKKIRGVLFLGFESKECMNNQELDFYEAFAMEASFALSNYRKLKNSF